MAMDATTIKTMLEKAIPGAEIVIKDIAGDGEHYAAEITSENFRGKTRIEQHQMVHKALKGHVGTALHALTIKTKTPNL